MTILLPIVFNHVGRAKDHPVTSRATHDRVNPRGLMDANLITRAYGVQRLILWEDLETFDFADVPSQRTQCCNAWWACL